MAGRDRTHSSRYSRTCPVVPGSTEHLVLLAARAAGRIESAALTERFGRYPSDAIARLCNAGLLDRLHGHKTVVLAITANGRAQCPNRRTIPNRPLHA